MSPHLHIPRLVGWLAAFLAGPAATYGVARWLGRAPQIGTAAMSPAPADGAMADASMAAIGRPKEVESAFLEQIRAERRLETMPPSDARALVLAGRAFPDRLPDLLKQWAAGDGKGALEWVMKQHPVPENLLGDTALAFFKADPEAAMKTVMALGTEGQDARDGITAAFLSGDPATAGKIAPYVDDLFASDPRMNMEVSDPFSPGFPAIPEGDRRAFGERIEGLPPSRGRQLLLEGLGKSWFSLENRDAWDWAKTLPPDDRRVVENALISEVKSDNFSGKTPGSGTEVLAWARDWLAQPERGAERAKHGVTVTEAIAMGNFREGWNWAMETLDAAPLTEAIANIVADVKDSDRATAVELVQELPPGRGRERLLEALGKSWFSLENRDAWDWAKTLPPEDRRVVESALISEVNTDNFSGKPPGSETEVLAWAKDWLAQPDRGAERAKHGVSVTEAIAMGNFREGWNWAMETLDAGPLTEAIGLIVTDVNDSDRATAVELVQDLPPGGVRTRAIDALAEYAKQKAESDPAAAQAWADSLPAGPVKTGIQKALEEKAGPDASSGGGKDPFAP